MSGHRALSMVALVACAVTSSERARDCAARAGTGRRYSDFRETFDSLAGSSGEFTVTMDRSGRRAG